MAAIFFVAMATIFFLNQNFVTKMCFKHKKSDVMVILSKIEISVADGLNDITSNKGGKNYCDKCNVHS